MCLRDGNLLSDSFCHAGLWRYGVVDSNMERVGLWYLERGNGLCRALMGATSRYLSFPKTRSGLIMLHLGNSVASLHGHECCAAVLSAMVSTLIFSFRSRLALQAEILAMRHQLKGLQRSLDARKQLRTSDRVLWIWLSRLWRDSRSALLIVKPETVVRWHRKGFRLYWRWRSSRPGRPDGGREIRELIREMCLANPTWGPGASRTAQAGP